MIIHPFFIILIDNNTWKRQPVNRSVKPIGQSLVFCLYITPFTDVIISEILDERILSVF